MVVTDAFRGRPHVVARTIGKRYDCGKFKQLYKLIHSPKFIGKRTASCLCGCMYWWFHARSLSAVSVWVPIRL
eukprot:41822-Eustigmatos_ZCMA.PRE.1